MRDQVVTFAKAMEGKLSENDDDKRGWEDCSIEWLILRLEDEVAELKKSFAWCNAKGVREEAVDVGNFAMMIVDNLTRNNHK